MKKRRLSQNLILISLSIGLLLGWGMGAQALIIPHSPGYTEDFESIDPPDWPSGWTADGNFVTYNISYCTNAAMIKAGTGESTYTTDTFDFRGLTLTNFDFQVMRAGTTTGDVKFQYSIDGGAYSDLTTVIDVGALPVDQTYYSATDGTYGSLVAGALTAISESNNVVFKCIGNRSEGKVITDEIIWTTTGTYPYPTVTTQDASSIGTTTATLNCDFTMGEEISVDVYFQWGESSGSITDNETTYTPYGVAGSHTATPSFSKKTKYQFRGVVEYDSDHAYGDIKTFQTHPEAGENYLYNEFFDDITGSDPDEYTWGNRGERTTDPDEVLVGEASFAHEPYSDERYLKQLGKDLEVGKTYYVVVWAKGTGKVKVGVEHAGGIDESGVTDLDGADWTKISHSYVIGAGEGTTNGGIAIGLTRHAATGERLILGAAWLSDGEPPGGWLATKFSVVTEHSGTETAGTTFSVTVTAQRQDDTTVTDYTGSHYITWTWNATAIGVNDPTKPADGNQTFANGVATVSGFTLYNAGETPWIKADDGAINGTSTNIAVDPDNPNKLDFTTPPSDAAIVGFPFATQPKVSVKDTYGNVTPAAIGTVILALHAGAGALLPNDALTEDVVSGVASYSGIYYDTGETIQIDADSSAGYTSAISISIEVTDNNLPLINITESPVPSWKRGDWEISYTLIDADSHSCTGYPEYSTTGDEIDWHTASTDPASEESIGTPGEKTITWATATDLPTTEDDTVYFRMKANDGADDGSYGYMGDTASSPGTPFGIDNVVPSGLADFKASSATSTSITFSWTACTESYFSHYEIWYGKDQTKVQDKDNTGSPEGATKKEETDIDTSSTIVTGLTSPNIYYAKIWAMDNAGNETTSPSGTASVSVGLADVQESESKSSSSKLTWTPFTPSDKDFLRYRIYYGTNRTEVENKATSYWDDSNDVDLATRATTSTTITGLSGGTTYYIQLWGVYSSSPDTEVSTPVVTITTPAAAKEEAKSTSEKWGCFIATAAYSSGTDSHRFITDSHRSQIIVLQRFRDEHLLTNSLGKAFVRFYCRFSPPVARFISDKEPLKAMVRFYLKPIVWGAKRIVKEGRSDD